MPGAAWCFFRFGRDAGCNNSAGKLCAADVVLGSGPIHDEAHSMLLAFAAAAKQAALSLFCGSLATLVNVCLQQSDDVPSVLLQRMRQFFHFPHCFKVRAIHVAMISFHVGNLIWVASKFFSRIVASAGIVGGP